MPAPTPRLVHPQVVVIEPLSRATSNYDAAAREPIPRLRRSAPVTIRAQIHWARRIHGRPQPGGPEEKSDGFLVFVRQDLTSAGYTPARGDRVASIEGQTVELYLKDGGQLRGQYDQRYNLVRIFFEDRQPRHD